MPYRTRCRFLRDSNLESEISWEVAQPDAPTLPFESSIVNSFNEFDKEHGWPVGEVWGASRPYTGRHAPAGLVSDHVCGTEDDFAQGGKYDAAPPFMRYGALGYPLCCDPPVLVRGGGSSSGGSSFSVRPALARSSGARGGGGSSVDVRHALARPSGARGGGGSSVSVRGALARPGGGLGGGHTRPTFGTPLARPGGGFGGGRSIPYVIGLPCNPEAARCDAAGSSTLGKWCEFNSHSRVDLWRRWSTTPGRTYQLQIVWDLSTFGSVWILWVGALCTSKVIETEGTSVPRIFVYEFVATEDFAWWMRTDPIFGSVLGIVRLVEF